MNKIRVLNFRTTIILSLLAITICAVGCFTAGHQTANKPTYQNRRLSEWLRDFDNNNLTPEQKAMAAEAIRHIGSSAVPFLVERLSEARLKQSKIEQKKWRDRQATAVFSVVRPPDPRHEALAGLDALGSAAVDALPALEKLLHENPPDPQALYVAARIGPASIPILTAALTNEEKLVRLEAQLCLEMLNSRSELLYPRIPVGPEAPSFNLRICEFNVRILQSSFKEYQARHPEMNLPNDVNQTPPPSLPPP